MPVATFKSKSHNVLRLNFEKKQQQTILTIETAIIIVMSYLDAVLQDNIKICSALHPIHITVDRPIGGISY